MSNQKTLDGDDRISPMALYDRATGLPAALGGSAGGAGGAPAVPSITTNSTRAAQKTPTFTTVAVTAATPFTIFAADPTLTGCRILNYIAAGIYFVPGVTGTPASGAGSDYIPVGSTTIPAQYESPFQPVDGLRGVCASSGSITVETW